MRVLVGVLLGVALLVPASAQAAFPGANGKIAFESARDGDRDIYAMNPDGTGVVQLTNSPVVDTDPEWSPDGTKIAFTSGSTVAVMNADGSGATPLVSGSEPAWSPDGAEIAYASGSSIYAVPSTGGSSRLVAQGNCGNPPCFHYHRLEWSPNGELIAVTRGDLDEFGSFFSVATLAADGSGEVDRFIQFSSGPDWAPSGARLTYEAPSSTSGHGADIWRANPDGSSASPVADTAPVEGFAAASPDGTRIAFVRGGLNSREIWVMDASGANPVQLTSSAGDDSRPDWQPILKGYARPKAASPLYASLVPAYTPCAAPNRTHAAPLAYGSCNPPAQTSTQLTNGTPDANQRGANSVGKLRLVAVGELPINLNNGNQSDITIDFSLTDVRNTGDLSDYTGQLTAKTTLRITDRANTPYPGGPGPGTVADTTFDVPVQCVATGDPAIGATCATTTTANALIPNSVIERRRAIWELGQVRVLDGNGGLFAVQGLFVP